MMHAELPKPLKENLTVWPCDTEAYFYNQDGMVATDPSLLLSSNKAPLPDKDAILSVLQFGAIVPPLSPWTEVSRIVPGFKYAGIKRLGPVGLPKIKDPPSDESKPQANHIEQLVDFILKTNIGENDNPILLFSGGVDSGFIASRLAALGFRDTLLINYSFGDYDLESKISEKMAAELGLPYQRIFAEEGLCQCLKQPGQIYSQPFGDHSTVPTSALARAVVNRFGNERKVIIDGTGADGAFGMLGKIKSWQSVERVPVFLRLLVSLSYEKLFWRNDSRFERLGRICRRSTQLPIAGAVIAQNALAGIFYSDEANNRLGDLLEKWIEGWVGNEFEDKIVGSDLALTCANIFAQKARPIFQSAGHRVLYPFLDSQVVSHSFSASRDHCLNEPKAVLKKSLAQYVSADLVYRPKSGFVDPRAQVFYSSEFRSYLAAVTDQSSPLTGILDHAKIKFACDLLAKQRAIPIQTLNLLWAIVFTDRWYRTVKISAQQQPFRSL